jgi:hypothetical protein
MSKIFRINWGSPLQWAAEEYWAHLAETKIDKRFRRLYLKELRKAAPIRFITKRPKFTGIISVMESLDKK